MDRKLFLKTCLAACPAILVPSVFLQACSKATTVAATRQGNVLRLPLKAFEASEGDKSFKKYVLIEHESLKTPIVVSRLSDDKYSALLMQCSHRRAGLRISGEILHCPSHGSEFGAEGEVLKGPASAPLVKFPVEIKKSVLEINLDGKV